MATCKGIRKTKQRSGLWVPKICSNPAKFECPACDKPLCKKCTYDASRHREKCYGGKDIDKEVTKAIQN